MLVGSLKVHTWYVQYVWVSAASYKQKEKCESQKKNKGEDNIMLNPAKTVFYEG